MSESVFGEKVKTANFILVLSSSIKALPRQGNIIASYLLEFESIGIITFQTLSGILSEHIARESVLYVISGMLFILLVMVIAINYWRRIAKQYPDY